MKRLAEDAKVTDITYLKKVIEHQANLEILWGDPLDRRPTMQEAMLKAALRHVHALVEGDEYGALKARKIYWNVEDDL